MAGLYFCFSEGAAISQSGMYFTQSEEALGIIKDRNPQHFIEGCKNTWIIKPGAKSRGRGKKLRYNSYALSDILLRTLIWLFQLT